MYIVVDSLRLFIGCFCAFVCQYRIELCQFSGYKILPGHGKRYVRLDGKVSISKEDLSGISWCAFKCPQ